MILEKKAIENILDYNYVSFSIDEVKAMEAQKMQLDFKWFGYIMQKQKSL